jgi:hypothetical protein
MWRTERGKEIAWKYAFHDLSYAEYFRLPMFLLFTETLRQKTLSAPATGDQEQLFWDLVVSSFEAYAGRKQGLDDRSLVALAFTFKGDTTFLWKGAAAKLDPSLRGPIAYVMGMRYLKRNKRDEARDFFAAAVKDAKPDSRLHRLAKAELQRLPGR